MHKVERILIDIFVSNYCDSGNRQLYEFMFRLREEIQDHVCKLEKILAASRQNLSLRFPTRSDTNQAVQPHKMARRLKFRI